MKKNDYTLMTTQQNDSIVSVYRQHAITDKLLKTTPEWQTKARKLIESKKWKELVSWSLRWTKAEPNNADAFGNLGRGYTNIGQYKQAVSSFQKALSLNPESSTAMYTMGIAYYNLECFNEAIEAYQKTLRINPGYSPAWDNLAITYSLSGDKNAAMSTVEELRQLNPEQAHELLQFISMAC